MGLVLYALKYRITFYVLSLLILLGGIGASVVTPKDVLPNVNIPVVVVVWTYNGLNATDMASRITTYSEFSLSNNVNNIERMESTTLPGTAIERIFFQQNVSIDLAITQVVSAMNSIRAVMPPGVQPPVIMRFSASSVPVIQLALSSKTQSQAQIFDYAQYRIRQTLTQVPGSTLPSPYGGAPRQVMVDLDLQALQGYGLTPLDVTNAIVSQNIVVPSGLSKIGETQYPVRLNASPQVIDDLNQVPIKVVGGAPVLVRDVAYVRDGSPPQLNIVRTNGLRSVLETILKNGEASTLTVVNNVKSFLPQIKAAAPKGLEITPLADQSVFVTGAINDVVREALIAATLTGLMILLFLGSWRSTIVVLVSIPLAILFSLIVLSLLGETLNIMTLGGLALAVGILVDDATVAIENTYRLMESGKGFRDSVVEGAAGIAKPALISTLAICSAFVSVFFLTDAPKYLFTPQAMAVVFAMLASYLLSRTLVPILVDVLVRGEYEARFGGKADDGAPGDQAKAERADGTSPGWFKRAWAGTKHYLAVPFVWVGHRLRKPAGAVSSWLRWGHGKFESGFKRFHRGYIGLLHATLAHRVITLGVVGCVFLLGAGIFMFTGQDYFPQVDANSLTLHVRTRPGQRLETAEQYFSRVEKVVREVIPEKDLGLILDNIGLPSSNYNFAFGDGSFVSYNDGQMIISLNEGHAPGTGYMKKLRDILPQRFPDALFYFQPSDMITQILDFGTITPIDIQVSGRDREKDLEVAREIAEKLKAVRGAVDVHIHQITDAPEFFVDVDRKLASEIGLSEQQIAQSMNVSLSGSFQVQPNFWADPKTGIPYQVWVQTPEYRNSSLQDLTQTPLFITAANANQAIGTTDMTARGASTDPTTADQPGVLTLLSSVATIRRDAAPTVISHVNTQNTLDIFASAQDRDLGGISRDIEKIVSEAQKKLPAPDKITVRGQIESMHNAFSRIELGLALAMIAVYMLMVVNFQSWGDPFVVILALPIAFCGILTSLFLTHTALSIPSLFGAIMSVGVASANSILLVTFAREHREEHKSTAAEAAIAAGETRLRPVLMTAGAMFVGLLPMALGIGEGSEQNAALARAVLGGIAFGTCSTLLFVPFLYATLRQGRFKPVEDYR